MNPLSKKLSFKGEVIPEDVSTIIGIGPVLSGLVALSAAFVCSLPEVESPVTTFTSIFYPGYALVFGLSCLIPMGQKHFLYYWFTIAALFGLYSHLIVQERAAAWQLLGPNPTPKNYPYNTTWKEDWPASRGNGSIGKSLDEMPPEQRYGDSMRFEHMAFASIFGFMTADFFSPPMDLMFGAHHSVSIILALIGSFGGFLPGVTLLALATCIIEFGSITYNTYFVYGWRQAYLYVMPLSNIIYLIIIWKVGVKKFIQTRRVVDLLLCVAGVGLIYGRQAEWKKVLF